MAGRVGTLIRLGGWHDTSITLSFAIKGGLAVYHKVALALEWAAAHAFREPVAPIFPDTFLTPPGQGSHF